MRQYLTLSSWQGTEQKQVRTPGSVAQPTCFQIPPPSCNPKYWKLKLKSLCFFI